MLFQNKIKTASRKIGGFFMRHREERSNLILHSHLTLEFLNWNLFFIKSYFQLSAYIFSLPKKQEKGYRSIWAR
jgi:hypothetical protein